MQIPTNPMYDIDLNAVVTLRSSGEIVPERINRFEKRSVIIRGKSHKPSSHSLDRLMLNTYKPLSQDKDPEWTSVTFTDGDKNNVSIDNLEWNFDWYVPKPEWNLKQTETDWMVVYTFPSLQIRLFKDGTIGLRDRYTYKEVGARLENGYLIVTIPGYQKNIPYHRLIALAFLPHPIDTDHLTVNHKDSNKLNNTISNLEWATYSQNNTHAFAEGPRSETVRKIRLRNIESGEETVVAGYQEMARFMGVLPQAAHQAMERRKFEGRPYKGFVFKFDNDLRSWEELSKSGSRENMQIPKRIACRNMDTGEVKIYSSFRELLNAENIRDFTLRRLLNQKVMIPWRRRCFQIVNDDAPLIWPEYPKDILGVYEHTSVSDRPIQVTDKRGMVRYYSSVTNWSNEDRENRCDPAVMARYLKKNGNKPLRWRDWVIEHIDLRRYLSK